MPTYVAALAAPRLIGAPQATVQTMERAEQNLKTLFSSYVPGTRVEVSTGKKLAEELRGLLRSLVEMTHAMDAEQLKRILRAVKKSFEVILMIKVGRSAHAHSASWFASRTHQRHRTPLPTSASSRRRRPTTTTWRCS